MNLFLTNQGWISESELNLTLFNTNNTIYEVVRIIKGLPLFLEDHFNRLKKSFLIQGLEFNLNFSQFESNLIELSLRNQVFDGNVKFAFAVINQLPSYFYGFIPHNYPIAEDYLKGVKTDLFWAERESPNAKVIQQYIRERANQQMIENGLYEVLLVDRDGLITEGSRSNVFFVKENRFYTAPACQVLVGVTRQKVLDCLTELGYTIVEKAVLASEISTCDAAFLTGTSPKVLPVNSIGNLVFNAQHPSVNKLIDRYNEMILKYIGTH